MANGKEKKSKSVLLNQQVSKKGRTSSRTKAQRARHTSFIRPHGGHLRYLVALVLLGAAIGLMAALASGCGASDSPQAPANLLGPIGSAMAGELFGFLGLAAFAVPLWLAFIALRLFVRTLPGLCLRQWFGLGMLLLGGLVMGDLLDGMRAGGLIGAILGESLRSLLSIFGASLIAGMLIGAGLILLTRSAIVRWAMALFSLGLAGAGALCRALGHLSASAWQWFQAQREIWQRERAEEDQRFEEEMAELEAAEAARLEALASAASLSPAPPLSAQPETKLVLQSRIPESMPPDAQGALQPCAEPAEDSVAASVPSRPSEQQPQVRPSIVLSAARPTPDPAPAADAATLSSDIGAAQAGDAEEISKPEPNRPASTTAGELHPALADQPLEELDAHGPSHRPEIAFRESKTPTPLPEPTPEPSPAQEMAAASDEPVCASSPPQIPVKPQIFEPTVLPRPTAVPPQKRDPFAFEGASHFCLPEIELLAEPRVEAREPVDADACYKTAERLIEKLRTFHIPGTVKRILPGPVVTMYEFEPGPGIKISKISNLADDLAMAMEAMSVRIIAPLPGRGVVGIEVPNKKREMICLREIFEQPCFQKAKSKLAFAIGKDVEGNPYMTDLAKMPHLLIAGTTGSGKSVTVNTMIMSMLYKATPEEVRLIMVDPKVTELSIYEGIPHLLLPVVTDPKKAALALQWAVEEMERRYQLLASASVRNIASYNAWVEKKQAEIEAKQRAAQTVRQEQARAVTAPQQGSADGDAAAMYPETPATAAGCAATDSGQRAESRIRIVDVQGGEAAEEADARAMAAQTGDPSMAVTEPPTPAESAPSVSEEIPAPAALAPATAEDEGQEREDRRIDEEALELDARDAYEAEIARFMEEKANEPPQKLPYIVIIIDEVADLMMVVRNEVETQVARLAQKARAAGIHLMLATQRPSADIITGVIKANFPSRISCQLRSWQDSMTILGSKGAEALLGMGDMLILPPTSPNLQRVHGAFVSDEEIARVVDFLRKQGTPIYDESILRPRDDEAAEGEEGGGAAEDRDAMYDTCLALVSEMKSVSTSMLQRKLKLGYNRAARIIEQMEKEGIVGPANGSKPREVLIRPIGENYREVNL